MYPVAPKNLTYTAFADSALPAVKPIFKPCGNYDIDLSGAF